METMLNMYVWQPKVQICRNEARASPSKTHLSVDITNWSTMFHPTDRLTAGSSSVAIMGLHLVLISLSGSFWRQYHSLVEMVLVIM